MEINMENFRIEKLTEVYVDEVAALEKELIGSCDVDAIRSTISSLVLNYYVMIHDEKVVGFFECKIISPEAELYDIAVKKDFQGKGFATLMMNHFLSVVKQQSCDTILLEVNSINNKAISLYTKFGFVKYGERKNYYGDNDAILMKLEIV